MPRRRHRSALRLAAALALGLTLLGAGCGGGSGSLAATPPNPAADAGTGSRLDVPDLGSVAVGSRASALPAGWMNGVILEVYVRGYRDSDGDGKGDLRGLISRLDYLKDLGVSGLWLMPVTDSADKDHGYAVRNYRAVETDYGSLADFDALLAEAHRRGIGIIIDYVINHSSREHPLFRNSASSAANPQRDFFVWEPNRPVGWSVFGSNPWHAGDAGWYYASFDGGMPDFNLRSAAAVAFHQDNLRFWLNRGVDGIRLDAVGHLFENGASAWENQPENHVLLRELRSLLSTYEQRFMVCEAPSASHAFAASCGSAFAFDFPGRIRAALGGDAAAVRALGDYFSTAPAGLSTFFSNHDAFAGERLWDQVGGDLARYRLAAASYLLMPGTPFVYYGEEVGMSGARGLGGDPALRVPMSWTADATGFTTGTPFRALAANAASQNVATQSGRADSLLSFYKAIIGLRNSLPALARGSYESPNAVGASLSFRRRLDADQVAVVLNYGAEAARVEVRGLPPGAILLPRHGADATLTADSSGVAATRAPGRSVQVYQLQQP